MNIINQVQKLGGPTLRGLASHFAPQIAAGLMVEYLNKVKITEIITYVEKNISLWSQMTPEYQAKVCKMLSTQKNLSWLTTEWLIDAIRKDIPRLASLFLGWDKARNWLERQMDEIRQQGTL